jgi:FkbM family methyltransferase
MINSIAQTLRKTSFIKKNKLIRNLLKNMMYRYARIIYGEKREIKLASKFKIYLNSKFAFSNYENWGDNHNSGFNKLIELANNKKTVFDIGGHIGLTAIPLSKVIDKQGIVYVFEPSNNNRYYLNKHLEYNNIKNVKVIDKLLGNKPNKNIDFYELKDVSGTPSIVKVKDDFIKTTKEQITLDNFCEENHLVPELIKIDIEGAEIYALEGSIKTIKTYKPEIILSFHPKHIEKLGKTKKDLFDILYELNYEILDCKSLRNVRESDLTLDEYYLRSIL